MNRRDILKSTVAAAVSARIAVSRGMIWHGGAASGSVGATFDYYISPTGSDTNTGSLASPWAFTAINTKRATYGGRRVGIIAGTYNLLALVGGAYSTNPLDFQIAAFEIQGGSLGSPTYIGSSDTNGFYSPRAAILNGNATTTNNTSGQGLLGHNGVSGQTMGYVVIDGLQVLNGALQCINIGRALGIGLDNVPGIVIKNCYVNGEVWTAGGDNPAGIIVQNCNGALIQNNYVTNITYTTSRPAASGIQVYWSTNTVIEYCTVIQVDGTMSNGVSFKDTSQSNNIQRYNFVYMPFTPPGGSNCQPLGTDCDGGYFNVYNNISAGTGIMIPYIGGSPSPDPPTYAHHVYNNTMVGVSGSGWVNGIWRSNTANEISYYNNIIQRPNLGLTRGDFSVSSTSGALIDYNCYPSTSTKFTLTTGGGTFPAISNTYTSLAAWQAGLASVNPSCIGKDAHSIVEQDSAFFGGATQIFVGGVVTSPASYKLAAGSPCSGAGSSNGQVSGTAVDMGAWGGTDVNTGLPIAQIGCSFA